MAAFHTSLDYPFGDNAQIVFDNCDQLSTLTSYTNGGFMALTNSVAYVTIYKSVLTTVKATWTGGVWYVKNVA